MIDNNYCAFSKDHKCILWMDYELTRHELAEANELCHGNWIEVSTQPQVPYHHTILLRQYS